MTSLSISFLCTHLTATLQRMISLSRSPHGFTPRFPVFCGNFNSVFDRSLDCLGSDSSDISRESSVALSHLFELRCCDDIWCYLHPFSSCFTRTSPDGTLSSCIDIIGCPYVWVSSVSSCDVIPCPFSDDCAVLFCVSVPDFVAPGPSLEIKHIYFGG